MKCFELKSGSRQFSGRKIGVCLCELEVSRRRGEPRDGRRWRGDKWDGEMEINNVICVRWRLTKQSQDVLPQSTLIMKTGLDISSHYQHAGALSSPSLTIRQRWADVPLISSRLLLLGHIFINSVGTLLLLTASALQLGKYFKIFEKYPSSKNDLYRCYRWSITHSAKNLV